MSSSSSNQDDLVRKVEAVLQKASTGKDRPADVELGTVYSYCLPTTSSSTSSSSQSHWYCDKVRAPLFREAATYLIFIFAYRREGTSKIWLDTLESVLSECEDCARQFGAARRRFGQIYLGGFPQLNRVIFFSVLDKWQSAFILEEAKKANVPTYGSIQSTVGSLSSLSTPVTQLLFAEPSLLDNADIATFIDASIDLNPSLSLANVAALGATPLLIHLLCSPQENRRVWAKCQLPAAARRRLSFQSFVETGVRDEVQSLYEGGGYIEAPMRWDGLRALLDSGCLGQDAVERGLLAGEDVTGKKQGVSGIMGVLSGLLGAQSIYFPTLLDIFTKLLHDSPTRTFWSFDLSPELPHTLFSEIKNNPSFMTTLEEYYKPDPASLPPTAPFEGSVKGKSKLNNGNGPLSWISSFLLSLTRQLKGDGRHSDTGFAEALAQTLGGCFQDLQHWRFTPELRAAAAKAGCDALVRLHQRLAAVDGSQQTALGATLDIHATFITTVALRSADHPLPIWADARDSACEVLNTFFKTDGRDIMESMLGLSLIVSEERRRQQKARRANAKGEPPPTPVTITNLHKAIVRADLWSMAYNALSPTDVNGMAIMMRSIASFSHVDKLNRNETWSYEELKVQDVVKEDDFVAAIRAVNNGIVSTRDPFAQALESLIMQADSKIATRLWDQPGVPKAAILLLLSPAEDVHDPTISLIQQSFHDVDDRGDCFRVLLQRFPAQAMDGLAEFLTRFIDTATLTPESCSLAKWLVRCFTDILDAMCQSTESDESLLQSQKFLSNYVDGIPMSKRVGNLWHLMSTSLAVIFKRTQDWAPLYDNETMIDWMRDALIFGRQMTEQIRAFEAAALGISSASSKFVESNGESPAKATRTGAKLVQKLENVLRDLVSWLRLTDLETLHQTFELIKTIVGRIAKTTPDVSQAPDLEATLLEIDKFSRRVSKSYRTRLSDDLLSELADLLTPFNLDISVDEDNIQFVKAVPTGSDAPTPVEWPAPPLKTSSVNAPKARNAFEEMMKKATSSQPQVSTAPKPSKAAKPSGFSKQAPINVDDFDDNFLSKISASDLDIIEEKARASTTMPPILPAPTIRRPAQPTVSKPPNRDAAAGPSAPKLSLNFVPKPSGKPIGGSLFKTQIMRDLRMQHKMDVAERKRNIGGVVPRLPAASGLGSGLGAYQGQRRPVKPVDSSGSSASDSSDEENRGVDALVAKQKSPKKISKRNKISTINHPIKILGTAMSDIVRHREDRRASQHIIKQRLRPDLSKLYRYILTWDPNHTGVLAPHATKNASELRPLGHVPTTFPSAVVYERVMLPLFLQELWAQCLKDPITMLPIPVEISSRAYEDEFIDMELTIQGKVPNDFHVNDTDIVILRHPTGKPVLAKVQAFRRKFKDTAMKVRVLAASDQRELAGRSKWQLQKRISLSTALREYGGLRGLPYYEDALLSDILSARSATMPRLSENDIDDARRAFDVNEPQARAILGAMSVEGFALIQGPPGTGKTKTISGLVGKFLSERDTVIPINGKKPVKPKLLVCAPSNAAIDEVCKRLMNGVPSSSGSRLNPTIIRIGIDSSVNFAVKDISLDSLVEARVNTVSDKNGGGGDYSRIQGELENVKRQIREKQEELSAAQGHDEKRKTLENEYQTLIQKRTQLGQQSSKAKDAARDATRHLEGARRAARDAILNEADIICATLSGSGQESLAPFTFETVIIDEAAQAIEMSCLIPLKYGCRRCIMVGDPNQLPPTTFSTDAERFHYNESLFVRMTKQSPANVQLLSIQYRMNPFISELPSKVFYNGQLKDGPGMAQKTAAIWHQRQIFGPYRFFNVDGVESKAGTSTKNSQEALVAVELYRRLEDDFGAQVNLSYKIGIISMYKEQLWELRRKFTEVFGAQILERIDRRVSGTRKGYHHSFMCTIGTWSTIDWVPEGSTTYECCFDTAKSSLFVIGNATTLERSDDRWKTIVGDARERGFLVEYHSKTFAPEVQMPPMLQSSPRKKIKKKRSTTPLAKVLPGGPTVSNAPPAKSVAADATPLKRKPTTELRNKSAETSPKIELTGSVNSPNANSNKNIPSLVPLKSGVTPTGSKASGSNPVQAKLPKPPAIPPPPPRIAPPPRPPPLPEDVLFIKKKKKGNKPPVPLTGSAANPRATFNHGLPGHR